QEGAAAPAARAGAPRRRATVRSRLDPQEFAHVVAILRITRGQAPERLQHVKTEAPPRPREVVDHLRRSESVARAERIVGGPFVLDEVVLLEERDVHGALTRGGLPAEALECEVEDAPHPR